MLKSLEKDIIKFYNLQRYIQQHEEDSFEYYLTNDGYDKLVGERLDYEVNDLGKNEFLSRYDHVNIVQLILYMLT